MLSHNAKIIETILFIENEALTIEKLAAMSNISEKECEKAINELKKAYEKEGHGIYLKTNEDETFCFSPLSELYDDLRQTYGKKVDKRLSRAALETLSIVAYSQPITRKEIDNIRGVTSDTIVRLLRDREYIKIVGRKDVQGHPCLYGTSRKFLFEFGLQSISDLPKLSDIDKMRFDKGEGEEKWS